MMQYDKWYVIAWRLLWAIPYFTLWLALTAVIGIMWGPRSAATFWRDGLVW